MFSAKIDHVAIRLNDIEASIAFPLDDRRAARWKIGRQTADHAAFSLGASDGSLIVIDDVRRFLADAIAAGYRSNGEPGERPRYHGGYHAAYVRDADRNQHRSRQPRPLARIAILPAQTIADGAPDARDEKRPSAT